METKFEIGDTVYWVERIIDNGIKYMVFSDIVTKTYKGIPHNTYRLGNRYYLFAENRLYATEEEAKNKSSDLNKWWHSK